jgi:hypothetical protein
VNLRGTGGMLAVAAALLAALWIGNRPEEPPIADAPPLLARTAVVARVEIRRESGTRRFRADGRGRLLDDRGMDAGGVVAALRTLAPLMTVAKAPGDPSEFGFDRDALRLVVRGDQSLLLDLEIGARNPAWTGLYVRRHGTRDVELVGALLHWELAKLDRGTTTENALTRRHETREPSPPRPAKEAP